MKANEFVKKFGWPHAVRIYENAFEHATHARADYEYFKNKDGEWFRYEDDFNLYVEKPCFKETVCLKDLKQLIEAKELVEKCGGIESLKSWLNYEKRKVNLSVLFHCNKPPVLINIEIAEKAIQLVESVENDCCWKQ